MNSELADPRVEQQESARVVLFVPKKHVKTVKTALEQHGRLDQTSKISPESHRGPGNDAEKQDAAERRASSDKMRIATTIPYESNDPTTDVCHETILLKITNDLDISHISKDISISYHTVSTSKEIIPPKNALHKALHSALSSLSDTIFSTSNLTRADLVSSFPDGYSIYPPLLLLPHNALASPSWSSLLTTHPPSSTFLEPLWTTLATVMNVTHIAINSPIPLSQSSSTSAENILRSPLNITPLFGDFGTTPTKENKQNPTQKDFNEALWVSTTQNGIHQVWAPLFTMFSRGNIREKTRVLNFPGPSSTVKESVVDMYSGIGYFSFSYRTSSFRPIFCFELNPWSVEGLRRGAAKNGWSCKIYTENDIDQGNVDLDLSNKEGNEVDFHIFQTSNTYALLILSSHLQRGTIPPIRHVNLGLLPHSRDIWKDAVGLVDKEMGGWIHAHENVGVVELEERKVEVESTFQKYLDEMENEEGRGSEAKVSHVERVKMYAPGVVHVVFDVWVGKAA